MDKKKFVVLTEAGNWIVVEATDDVEAVKKAETSGNDKAVNALNEYELGTAYREVRNFYPVIEICREDLKRWMTSEELDQIDEGDMVQLTKRLAYALFDTSFWDVLDTIVEEGWKEDVLSK